MSEAKEKKAKTPKRKDEGALREKYEGIVEGSLNFETEGKYEGKQTVLRVCSECSEDFRIATSDLWQKDACDPCTEQRRKDRAKAKRAATRAEKEAKPAVAA